MILVGIIVLLLAIVIYISFKQQDDIQDSLQPQYISLNKIIVTTYDVKICPKCFEREMVLLSVSITGQSIEYRCKNCSKKLTSSLLPGKNGSEAAYKFKQIQHRIDSYQSDLKIVFLKADIEMTFFVDAKLNNSFENSRRTSIPESVRNEVWRRDQGKCVDCGSQKNLEFDHIIPISKGGSSTARNLQLLCETCNRKKSNKI